jgi:hypothetical protein
LNSLATAFPSLELLHGASLDDFQSIRQVGPVLAAKLFANKLLPADKVFNVHNGVARVTVWNKVLRKRIGGAAGPTTAELEEWLAARSTTHGRYDFQDERDDRDRGKANATTDGLTLAAAGSSADSPASVEHTEFPDLKGDVNRGLADVLSQLDGLSHWCAQHFGNESNESNELYNLSESKKEVEELRERLTSGSGQDAAFVGANGVGKSVICNLLILNSSIDEKSYQTREAGYVPEALLHLGWQEPPTHAELVKRPDAARNVKVTVLAGGKEAASAAAAEYAKTEGEIKAYCEKGGNLPQLKRYVLPSGVGGGSTTSLHTRVRYGSVVHLLVEHYDVDELKQKAFAFVLFYRELDSNGRVLMKLAEEEKESFKERWYTYLNITSGPYKRNDLPRLKDVPRLDTLEKTWQDITPCDAIVSIVSPPIHLYLGAGVSLHSDRMMVHDLVEQLNNKEQLHRYAIKCVENYQPAGVLEGGNGFLDLPGLNDVDTGCAAQTREGVKAAGVVFVVLAKSLREDKDSLRLLRESETVKRAAAGEANVVFLFNREPQAGCRFRELETDGEMEVRAMLERNTREIWCEELLEANAKEEEGSRKLDAEIEQIARYTHMMTIYPMLHSSYKLNWEQAMEDVEAQGDLSGSAEVFELSNVYWLSGILEALNRQGLVDHLKRIATVVLPALREKLKDRLADAISSPDNVPASLVEKANKMLKSRACGGQFGLKVEKLNEDISKLGHLRVGTSSSSDDPTSIRLKLDQLIEKFMAEGPEITTYLDQGRARTEHYWDKLSLHMSTFQAAYNAVDPTSNGAALLETIFGRQVPFSFASLLDNIDEKLTSMREIVVDMVIKQVDELLLSRATPGEASSIASLRDSFVTSDVIKPLEDRFSVTSFMKAKQRRHHLLINGKLDEYLKWYAAQQAQAAIKNKILSRSSEQRSAAEIRQLVLDNREPVRKEWRKLLSDGIRNFVGGQFVHLTSALQFPPNKKRAMYTTKRMLSGYLEHIVTTAKVQQNEGLQHDLSAFIESLAYKIDCLQSLSGRLDGPHDPHQLGIAFARHVERRRQREQTEKVAQGAFKLGDPDKPMPIVALSGEKLDTPRLLQIATHVTHSDLFPITPSDAVDAAKAMLPSKFNLKVVEGFEGNLLDAVAFVAYTDETLAQKARDPEDPNREHTRDEHIKFAASQLRAVAASHLAQYFSTDLRVESVKLVLDESITDYVARISGAYCGDVLCLWALAVHFQRAFRVWVPGSGSILIPAGRLRYSRDVFHLMIIADPVQRRPPAAHFSPTWYPVEQLSRKAWICGSANVPQLPATDDDLASRNTSDEVREDQCQEAPRRSNKRRQGE